MWLTRRYLHLALDGRTFTFSPERLYWPLEPADAIRDAFAGWAELMPQPDDPAVVRAALERACARRSLGSG